MPAFIPSSATIPPLIERGDDGGFFLTEMELQSAYLPAAKGLALGAYQLYGQGDVQSALVTFRRLGVVHVASHQYTLAYDYHVKCMTIATAEHDHELASRTYANLGNVFAAKRQFADAIASHTNDLSLSTQVDSYVGMARAHRNLAIVYAKMNDVSQQRHHDAQVAAKGDTPFVHDMTHHAHDVVGNLYCQVEMGTTAMVKATGQCVLDLLRNLP
ncbi:hypothetical protein DYB26_010438 [Aphanomyces astaci]|uniref:MalT-like TPR region domain-containing protein n=2 Tax=Aphanomyces astaci TaxID=112090 RepID=A0A3R6Z5X0_APHAT|nr:hypothetical protein DYB26_010438 [Aphanomyces astaci]